ncbi:MAG: recombination mediator RecR [SAR202 cluster bacterium]|nr:recombination mediator RecR [SAR202 cluster bacterium]
MSNLEYSNVKPINNLIESFHRLPGIGPKMAQRLTYYLVRMSIKEADTLANAIRDLKEKVIYCSSCHNISDINPCSICQDTTRDSSIICVVEDPLDVVAIESSTVFKGIYHVLHGVIAPMKGIGPEDIKLHDLVDRINQGNVKELVLATNPNVEGDATTAYIQDLVVSLDLKITRLARGLPMGGDLEYADFVTLSRAIEGRQVLG